MNQITARSFNAVQYQSYSHQYQEEFIVITVLGCLHGMRHSQLGLDWFTDGHY